jgi:hypothetical protein
LKSPGITTSSRWSDTPAPPLSWKVSAASLGSTPPKIARGSMAEISAEPPMSGVNVPRCASPRNTSSWPAWLRKSKANPRSKKPSGTAVTADMIGDTVWSMVDMSTFDCWAS